MHRFGAEPTSPSSPSTTNIKMNAAAISSLLLLLFLSSASGQKTWCVAKPSSDEPSLMANVNYACSQVDCGVLRKGCPCFYPNNLMNHASVAMNLYYQAKGRNKWNCNFRNSGLIVVTDPSYNNCVYA